MFVNLNISIFYSSLLMIIVYCRDWIIVQQRIREHQDFSRWFVEYPEVLKDK